MEFIAAFLLIITVGGFGHVLMAALGFDEGNEAQFERDQRLYGRRQALIWEKARERKKRLG